MYVCMHRVYMCMYAYTYVCMYLCIYVVVYINGRDAGADGVESEQQRHEQSGHYDVSQAQQAELALDAGRSVRQHPREEQLDRPVEGLGHRHLVGTRVCI